MPSLKRIVAWIEWIRMDDFGILFETVYTMLFRVELLYLCSYGCPVLVWYGSLAPVLGPRSLFGICAASLVGSSGYVVEGKLSKCLRWCSCA